MRIFIDRGNKQAKQYLIILERINLDCTVWGFFSSTNFGWGLMQCLASEKRMLIHLWPCCWFLCLNTGHLKINQKNIFFCQNVTDVSQYCVCMYLQKHNLGRSVLSVLLKLFFRASSRISGNGTWHQLQLELVTLGSYQIPGQYSHLTALCCFLCIIYYCSIKTGWPKNWCTFRVTLCDVHRNLQSTVCHLVQFVCWSECCVYCLTSCNYNSSLKKKCIKAKLGAMYKI